MQIIGIDIGGTKCAISEADFSVFNTIRGRLPLRRDRYREEAELQEVARFPTRDVRTTLDRIFSEVEALVKAEAEKEEPRSPVFGISCGGPLDAKRGVILSPPNLPGWDEIEIVAELTRRFGGEAFLMNDANACALAEWQWGAGEETEPDNLVFLTMGTGMGAGLIFGGRLIEGVSGSAGEVGHLRLSETGPVGFGKAGSFEGWCSGGGVAQLARMRVAEFVGESLLQKTPIDALTARSVGEAAEAGDALALAIWSEVGERLGQALAMLIDTLNPELIVIGSIYARCERFIAPAMHGAIEREALGPSARACKIVPAVLGEQIGNYGSIAAAHHGLLKFNS